MELRDVLTLLGIAVAAAGVFVAWLKYRHDVRVRKEEAKPRPTQPFINVTHTVTRSSFSPDEHSLRLEISNRDEKPIALKAVCWYVKSFGMNWPLSSMQIRISSRSESSSTLTVIASAPAPVEFSTMSKI